MKRSCAMLVVTLTGLFLACAVPVQAQEGANRPTPPSVSITLDVHEVPLREALTKLFETAKVDFSIDPRVDGMVTMRLADQPFETALRLMLRTSPIPLSYSVDSNVYQVKPREVAPPPTTRTLSAPEPPSVAMTTGTQQRLEVIHLTYIDPADLAQLLGIQILQFNVRANGFGGMGRSGMGNGTSGNGMFGNGGVGNFGNGILSNRGR